MLPPSISRQVNITLSAHIIFYVGLHNNNMINIIFFCDRIGFERIVHQRKIKFCYSFKSSDNNYIVLVFTVVLWFK